MRPPISNESAGRRLVAAGAALFLVVVSVQSARSEQQRPARVIPLALENVTLECQDDGTLTRIESRATEPVMGRDAAAESAAIGRARDRVVAQLSRFLANEKAASQALQQALPRMAPPLGSEAANRLSATIAEIARSYGERTLSAPTMGGTKSADGMTLSLTATLAAPFKGPSAGGAATTAGQVGTERRPPAGVLGSILGGSPNAPPPPPPPPNAPVKIGEGVTPPTKVKHVAAVYPPIAQTARVSGAVTLEITIGADGKVRGAKVLKSIPLLDQAATDAVKQWEFTPTQLNGVAVPVIMTVTVNFTLQ